MVRSLGAIIWAICALRPGMNDAQAHALAKPIQASAREHHIDPYTLVAIFWHESHLRPSAVSPDGEDFGLGQIRARYLPGCDRNLPAASDQRPSCQAVKARLLDPTHNIRATARIIAGKRKACRTITGRARFQHWLAAYGGMGTCGQVKRRGRWRDLPLARGVKEIMACRESLSRGRKCTRAAPRASASR